jgi:hypothetical protein
MTGGVFFSGFCDNKGSRGKTGGFGTGDKVIQ